MFSDDPQSLLLEHQVEAVVGELRLIVHTLGGSGQATWHVAERSVPPAAAGWVSIAQGREQTTQAAMRAAESEANRHGRTIVPGSWASPAKARLDHKGVEFFLAPVVPAGTQWTIFPVSGPSDGAASGVVFGAQSFQSAFAHAQAAIDSWLLAFPDDCRCVIH